MKAFAAMQAAQPGFKLDEVVVNSWSEELRAGGHVPEAVALLELNVRMHPQSTMAHLNLGKAFQQAGDGPRAGASFRKALAINACNPEARRRLRALEGPDAW
jgi:Flp pilus assembly protein TadD